MLLSLLLILSLDASPPLTAAASDSLGAGIVKPRLEAGTKLYFYNEPDLAQPPDAFTPEDSLLFEKGPHNVEIAYAPPWFFPEVLKLDYEILLLHARTLATQWVEVVVNRDTGHTRWVDREAVEFFEWPDFLLNVVAVAALDPEANPIRSGPDESTPALSTAPAQLRPVAVRGSWLEVSTAGLADRIVPTGWLRWRDGDRLLVSYSLLS